MIRASIPGSRYDAIIVGARVAGASTAMLLARAGHRVLAIDRGRYGTDTLSTHALMRGAVLRLHRWHVLPDVIVAGTPPVRQATFFYGDEHVAVPIAPRDGVDALYAPRRHVLDRLLVDAASLAGAEIVFGVKLRALRRAAGGRVDGVVLEDEAGGVHEVTSKIVVGADGRQSTVARLVDAPMTRVGEHATGTLYGHFADLAVTGYEWYFAAGVAAGAIPTNDGQTCVFVSVPSAAFATTFGHPVEDAFRESLSQAAPLLAGQVRRVAPARLHGFAGQPGYFRQSHGPGWALVGDAGYFKDPLTSHGITDALRDAELLAAAIHDGSDEALADYQTQRDAVSRDLFEATDAIASFAWDLNSVRVLHEALSKAMTREVKELASV